MMKNGPKTIASLFSLLQDKTEHVADYGIMERRLSVFLMDQELKESVEHLSYSLDFTGSSPGTHVTDRCILCYDDCLSDWESVLVSSFPKRKRIHDGSIGMLLTYEASDGVVIQQPAIGVVMIAKTGEILCVVTQKTIKAPSGASLNLSGLMHIIVLEVLARGNWTVVHAGGVSREGLCCLWTGPSGSGKTTRILELTSNGWQFYGDDLVLLRQSQNKEWEVWPLSKKIKPSIQTCKRIPQLRKYAAIPTPTGEHTLKVDQVFPVFRPTAGILYTIHYMTLDDEPYMIRLKPQEAFERIGICFLNYVSTHHAEHSIDTLHDIILKIPVYLVSRGWINAECGQAWERL